MSILTSEAAPTRRLHPLLALLGKRVALGVVTLFAVSVIIFSAVAFLPGTFAVQVLGQDASAETVAAFEREIGLDQPVVVRYLDWAANVLQGDFGQSFASRGGIRQPVEAVIGSRLRNTIYLALATAVITIPIALGFGIAAALFRNGLLDRVVSVFCLLTISVPEFFIAYLLILVLSVTFPILPSLSAVTSSMSFSDFGWALALPILTLFLGTVGHLMRMTRAAIVDVLDSPYMEMAVLKGIPPLKAILGHALPNAWAPIVTVMAFSLAYLVVGVVVVENVFVYPGIGQAMVDAVRARDIPVVQACTLIFAATYIVMNFLADAVVIASNPRVLYPR